MVTETQLRQQTTASRVQATASSTAEQVLQQQQESQRTQQTQQTSQQSGLTPAQVEQFVMYPWGDEFARLPQSVQAKFEQAHQDYIGGARERKAELANLSIEKQMQMVSMSGAETGTLYLPVEPIKPSVNIEEVYRQKQAEYDTKGIKAQPFIPYIKSSTGEIKIISKSTPKSSYDIKNVKVYTPPVNVQESINRNYSQTNIVRNEIGTTSSGEKLYDYYKSTNGKLTRLSDKEAEERGLRVIPQTPYQKLTSSIGFKEGKKKAMELVGDYYDMRKDNAVSVIGNVLTSDEGKNIIKNIYDYTQGSEFSALGGKTGNLFFKSVGEGVTELGKEYIKLREELQPKPEFLVFGSEVLFAGALKGRELIKPQQNLINLMSVVGKKISEDNKNIPSPIKFMTSSTGTLTTSKPPIKNIKFLTSSTESLNVSNKEVKDFLIGTQGGKAVYDLRTGEAYYQPNEGAITKTINWLGEQSALLIDNQKLGVLSDPYGYERSGTYVPLSNEVRTQREIAKTERTKESVKEVVTTIPYFAPFGIGEALLIAQGAEQYLFPAGRERMKEQGVLGYVAPIAQIGLGAFGLRVRPKTGLIKTRELIIPQEGKDVSIKLFGLETSERGLVFGSKTEKGYSFGVPDIKKELLGLSPTKEIKIASQLETETLFKNILEMGETTQRAREIIPISKNILGKTYNIKSSFLNEEFLTSATERLPKEGVRVILDIAKEDKGILFGSKSRAFQLAQEYKINKETFNLIKVPRDVELRFDTLGEKGLKSVTEKAVTRLKKLGTINEGNVKFELSTAREIKDTPFAIEAKVNGVYEKIAEFKGKEMSPIEEQVPEFVVGFRKVGEPFQTKEGVMATTLSEELRGVSQGVLRVRKDTMGLLDINPNSKRMKDIGSVSVSARTLEMSQPSTKLKENIVKFESLFPEELVREQVQKVLSTPERGVIADFSSVKLTKSISPVKKSVVIPLGETYPDISPKNKEYPSYSLSGKGSVSSIIKSPSVSPKEISSSSSVSKSPSPSKSISPSLSAIMKYFSPSISKSPSPSSPVSPSMSKSPSPSRSKSPSPSPSPKKSPYVKPPKSREVFPSKRTAKEQVKDMIDVFRKEKGSFTKVGEAETPYLAGILLKKKLLENLSASGYAEKKGKKISFKDLGIGSFAEPSKRKGFEFVAVQRKKAPLFSGRLSSPNERRAIRQAKKSKKRSWFD